MNHKLAGLCTLFCNLLNSERMSILWRRMSKEEGTSAKDLVTTKLIGVPTWQPAPTFEGVRSGDWSSAVLDLSVYPSQVA